MNNILAEGARAIADALCHNSTLQSLNLFGEVSLGGEGLSDSEGVRGRFRARVGVSGEGKYVGPGSVALALCSPARLRAA